MSAATDTLTAPAPRACCRSCGAPLARTVADLGLSLILISHDLGVIARSTDRTLVMCRGRAVEEGPTEQVLRHPTAQYTRDLIAALPRRARAGLGENDSGGEPRRAAGGAR